MDANEFLKQNLPGRSRKDLANESGLSDSTISRFLSGKQKLLCKNLINLSEAAASFSGINPQIMLYQLAELYNESYWQKNPSFSFDPEVYTDAELEEFLDKMLCRRNQSNAVNYNYLRCKKEIEELSMWARQHKLSPDFRYCLHASSRL